MVGPVSEWMVVRDRSDICERKVQVDSCDSQPVFVYCTHVPKRQEADLARGNVREHRCLVVMGPAPESKESTFPNTPNEDAKGMKMRSRFAMVPC